MATVYSPDPTYTGICSGLEFSCGIAESEDLFLLGWLAAKGFGVFFHSDSQHSFTLSEPLESHSENELLSYARAVGVDVGGINQKAQLIERIRSERSD